MQDEIILAQVCEEVIKSGRLVLIFQTQQVLIYQRYGAKISEDYEE
jgi:hypothetical protein